MAAAEPIFEDSTAPPASNRDPTTMVVSGNWFYPVTLLVPVVAFFIGSAFSTGSPMGMLAFGLVGSMTGIAMTMIATAWGVSIAFTDSTKAGLWFVLFPPYMPYFAATRWRTMAQPSVLFLSGLALAAATLWTVKLMNPVP